MEGSRAADMYFWSWGFQGIIALLFVLLIWSIPPPALAALLPFYSEKEFLWKEKMYVFCSEEYSSLAHNCQRQDKEIDSIWLSKKDRRERTPRERDV